MSERERERERGGRNVKGGSLFLYQKVNQESMGLNMEGKEKELEEVGKK